MYVVVVSVSVHVHCKVSHLDDFSKVYIHPYFLSGIHSIEVHTTLISDQNIIVHK